MKLCGKVAGCYAGVSIGNVRSFLSVCGFQNGGSDKFSAISYGTRKKDSAGLGFAPEPREIFGHQAFVAFGEVPARPFV